MKKIILEGQVKILGIKNFDGKGKLIDFYIEQLGQDKLYVFSKVFTQSLKNHLLGTGQSLGLSGQISFR